MSRSHRKTPKCGITNAASEKYDKRLANRRLRLHVRHALERGEETLPLLREVSTRWCMQKDGKTWFGWMRQYRVNPVAYWRTDYAALYCELMRK